MNFYKKLSLLFLSTTLSLAVFAVPNFCDKQYVSGNWQGWVQMDTMQFKAQGTVTHLFEDHYLIDSQVPELAFFEKVKVRCVNNQFFFEELPQPVPLRQSSNEIFIEYQQDNIRTRLVHNIG